MIELLTLSSTLPLVITVSQWLGYTILAFIAFVFICHLPILPIIRILKINPEDKGKIILCFIKAWFKNTLAFIPDMLAPVVVPIALLFTKWEADHLPRLFKWWDNDASINGDRRTDDASDGFGGWGLKPVSLDKDNQESIDMAYYAKGFHPRSFWARYVWLGLRNRASSLSQQLGYEQQPDDAVIATEYNTSNSICKINKVGSVYRYYEEIHFGKFYVRLHYGYKVPVIPTEKKAPVVAIGFSLRIKK
jgi:hypothetical protein